MEKRVVTLIGVAVLSCLLLSGCQNQGTVVSDISSKITLDSHGLVKFVNSSMQKFTDKAKNVESVKVSWMFENIAGRTISINIDVKFYDAANTLLYNQTKMLENMLAGYKEQYFSPANWVVFSGPNADRVDHVVISTTEIT